MAEILQNLQKKNASVPTVLDYFHACDLQTIQAAVLHI